MASKIILHKHCSNWYYKDREFWPADAKGWYGFVYRITFEDGTYYIGRRKFYGNWRRYASTSNRVRTKMLVDRMQFVRIILSLHKSSDALARAESKEIEKFIGSPMNLNCKHMAVNFDSSGIARTHAMKVEVSVDGVARIYDSMLDASIETAVPRTTLIDMLNSGKGSVKHAVEYVRRV